MPFPKADIALDETKVEELKRLVEIGHSEHISPCSPAVLQRWDHEAKQDPEGEGERVYTWKGGVTGLITSCGIGKGARKPGFVEAEMIVATIPLTLLGKLERFRGKYRNEKVIQGR